MRAHVLSAWCYSPHGAIGQLPVAREVEVWGRWPLVAHSLGGDGGGLQGGG